MAEWSKQVQNVRLQFKNVKKTLLDMILLQHWYTRTYIFTKNDGVIHIHHLRQSDKKN
jgi:hypothetical protein